MARKAQRFGDCEGTLLPGEGNCAGSRERCEKAAESFGRQFVTHATLCAAHAEMLGFTRSQPAPQRQT